MSERPRAPRAGALIGALLLAGPWAAVAADPPELPDSLQAYRRIELTVPPDFSAACERRGAESFCRVSAIPPSIRVLIERLATSEAAGVEFGADRQSPFVRFILRREGLTLQDAVLPAPPRWIIEIGTPTALMGPIEEELPFRPYPLAPSGFEIPLPPSTLSTLEGDTPGAQAYDACFEAWRGGRLEAALELCAEVDQSVPDRISARRAVQVIAEVEARLVVDQGRERLASAAAALERAEAASTDPLRATRYVLLAAQLFESLGYESRAELHLELREKDFVGKPGWAYLAAARARLLMRSSDVRAARPILEALRALEDDAPVVGLALRSLAGLAYVEGDFLQAAGLFDRVRGTWPELLADEPAALFQAAELYFMYGRRPEARALYETFLERYPDDLPHWVVRVRLGELLAFETPAAAVEVFRDLASSLRETEGQDLAFLRIARLTPKVTERRRILRNLRRGALTDYVVQEMLVASAREALVDGRLQDAFGHAKKLWTIFPDSPILTRAPKLFDRLLYLVALRHADAEHPLRAVSLYFDQRKRYEAHAMRGEMHLLAGRAFRRLAMVEEALRVMQRGLGGRTEEDEPDAAARLYLEMAGVLREAGDAYRLGEILAYLDARHPRRFDNYAYWMAKGSHALWSGRPALARDMLVYALNGPVTPDERIELAGRVAEVYIATGEVDRAINALQTQVELHDAAGHDPHAPLRRDARWRVAELELERARHAGAVAALGTFLEEFPDAPERFEARFFIGRSLMSLGDARGALRQWDIVANEAPGDVYGRLADQERAMHAWRVRDAAALVEQAGMATAAPAPSKP